ncbi:hypothetical protein HPB49_010979 [Dermacentor silvarum]|uniref:Uncharacterized protein n=1 Tax=Dermacentor silvarum TaxID=543639 RepID=A0ACB8CWZ2_DERSI|nr:hypothetical protein HPB49_010979 [Dermacentor silvarum]
MTASLSTPMETRIGSHGEWVIQATDDSSIIKINRIRFADHVEYTCFVFDDARSVNRSVELDVHAECFIAH